MLLTSVQKSALLAILSGSYTPYDLKVFVRLCYLLARPHIAKKAGLRRLDLSLLGISQDDAVYDCLADIFRRDAAGRFVEIELFFEREVGDARRADTGHLLVQLRRLVIGKVNNNLLRLYAEADPSLGKILRNIKLALDGDVGLGLMTRFNENYLRPEGVEPCLHLPPYPFEELRSAASGVILIHDNIPGMLRKLRSILAEQEIWQRIVPLVSAGLVFREVYTIGWEPDAEAGDPDSAVETSRLNQLVEKVCRELSSHLRRSYVATGKVHEDVMESYCRTLIKILRSSFTDPHLDGASFFEYLQEEVPRLTPESYRAEHKATLEYIVKLGKKRLKKELATD